MKRVFIIALLFIVLAGCSSAKNKSPVLSDFELTAIQEYPNIKKNLNISDDNIQALIAENSVVIPYGAFDEFSSSYKFLKEKDIPQFITSDSILYIANLQIDNILLALEEQYFYDALWRLSKRLYDYFNGQLKTVENNELKKSYSFLRVYFAVGLELLSPKLIDTANQSSIIVSTEKEQSLFSLKETQKYVWTLSDEIKELVNKETKLIYEHGSVVADPLFKYITDYSQFTPRGHYNTSAKLKNLFLAMMWFSKMGFLLNGGCPECLISEETALEQTKNGLVLTDVIVNDSALLALWRRIFDMTNFFIGFPDDLTVIDYSQIYKKTFESQNLPKNLEKIQDTFNAFKNEIRGKNKSKIIGTRGACKTSKDCPFVLEGLRLFGQKFTFDNYLMGQLVWPYVDKFEGSLDPFTAVSLGEKIKGFPRGMEIMALLGNNSARTLLQKDEDILYKGYGSHFNKLRQEVENLSLEEWQKNVYFYWLYTLKNYVAEKSPDKNSYAQSSSWTKRTLTTALSIWAKLKHDSVLYAKQAYMPIRITSIEVPKTKKQKSQGYIEPAVNTYKDLKFLLKLINEKLVAEQIEIKDLQGKNLQLDQLLDHVISISEKELAQVALVEEDYVFIDSFYEKFNSITDNSSASTIFTVDVFTEPNTKQVMESASGYLNYVIVTYADAEGIKHLAVGPVLSYYEFKQPLEKRLNDDEWKEMLNTLP